MKNACLFVIIVLSLSVFTACNDSEKSTGTANPASINCIKEGYNLTIKTNSDGSQTGYCIFPSGRECEEWQFLRGECKNE